MPESRAELLARAVQIRDEFRTNANTPMRVGGALYEMVSAMKLETFDVQSYGALGGGADDTEAIQDTIDAAEATSRGGLVIFPDGQGQRYGISSQLTVAESNIWLWAPGGARLKLLSAIPIAIAVGDIETGINMTQSNTLASDAAAGSLSVTLASGKGANFTAGAVVMVKSTAVVPEHHSAVVNKRAEFATIFDVTGDVLTLSRPLRYTYNTADTAEVYNISWVENFGAIGLGIDGNSQVDCSTGLQLSWCLNPLIRDISAVDLQQRFLRLQGCKDARVEGLRQTNGLSNGFQGDINHFSYSIIEGGLTEGTVITGEHVDRVRHGYTTGAGWASNSGPTSGVITGIGVPTGTIIADSVSSNARGTGWDTHEVGIDITFSNCKTLGGLFHGFVSRSVRTRFVDCGAYDTIGAAMQLGADAIDTIIEGFDWERTNLGVDDSTGTDWSKWSPIVDNSPRSYIGKPAPNLIDNGNFEFWDRGNTFSASGATANRWKLTLGSGAAGTVGQISHTPGGSELAESSRYYLEFDRTTTGSGSSFLSQYIEDIRLISGQRVVVSFDARATIDATELTVFLRQYFGTGGSPSASVDTTAAVRILTTGWHRYTAVFDVPSIAGQTIGSNEDAALILFFELPTSEGVVKVRLDRVKLEVGRTPTDFVPESYAEQRERCARWYQTSYVDGQSPGSASTSGNVLMAASTANANLYRRTVFLTTRMGRTPTITTYAPTSGTVAKVRNVTAGTDLDSTAINIGTQSFHAGAATGVGITALDVLALSWTAAVADFE
jgi:hypothetical protein